MLGVSVLIRVEFSHGTLKAAVWQRVLLYFITPLPSRQGQLLSAAGRQHKHRKARADSCDWTPHQAGCCCGWWVSYMWRAGRLKQGGLLG